MSFDEEYMHGYTAHEKHFNKMAEKAYPFLGNITQLAIFEFDSTGHAFLAANRPDFGEHFIENKIYKIHDSIIYGNGKDKHLVPFFSSPCEKLLLDKGVSLFGGDFPDMQHGFLYTEKLENEDSFRMYGVNSDSTKIYDILINDLPLAIKFIKYFATESENVINYYRERKFNLASQRDDYFSKPKSTPKSKKDKLVDLLRSFGKLDKYKNISNREWQCFELYNQGKSARETGEILGISNRTVETHFENLKNKLKAESKADLMEYLN